MLETNWGMSVDQVRLGAITNYLADLEHFLLAGSSSKHLSYKWCAKNLGNLSDTSPKYLVTIQI